ncbi:hypothetical protein JI739_13790 [Ramlibacter sp. AW1]|uniref:Uncharacterized protein n=1 Tax=Ramlibacter aurantiacus TaxID=2801330 RepID=A0A936ZKE3_9BURK|nr:hypothetical protein [Ramlibacter aurantiacus]MBL0421427.1 hypothetical protein [Ramlibacter aurantiacus]
MKDDPRSSTNPARPDRPTSQGNTQPAQGETQQPVPRRQYERDQSADSQVADNPSMGSIGRIAQTDAERGVADTSKGKELDETYQRQKPGTER